MALLAYLLMHDVRILLTYVFLNNGGSVSGDCYLPHR
jgi:hypothetical protein